MSFGRHEVVAESDDGMMPMVAAESMRPAEPVLAIEAHAVSKTYAVKGGSLLALDNVDIQVRDHEFICIVGASGCGKSTLIRLIAGLTAPTHGTLQTFGQDVDGPYKDIGVVFQSPVLLPWKTITNNVLFPIRVLGRPTKDFQARAANLLDLVGLDGFGERRPNELSGGMQQRVAIARALIHDPKLLIMDEPFGALDQITREKMNEELARIWVASKKTTVLITHSIEEAVFLADRVLVMTPRPGKVAGEVKIDLDRPREGSIRLSPEFSRLRGEVEELLEA